MILIILLIIPLDANYERNLGFSWYVIVACTFSTALGLNKILLSLHVGFVPLFASGYIFLELELALLFCFTSFFSKLLFEVCIAGFLLLDKFWDYSRVD